MPDKISQPFRQRLGGLRPGETIQAILLMRRPQTAGRARHRLRGTERQKAIESIRAQATEALDQLDDVLRRYQGQRLADQPNALGCIPIRATTDGVYALAELDAVQAILEDQPVTPID